MAKACNNKIGVFAKMIPSAGCQYKAKDFYQMKTASCTARYSFQLRNAPDDATCKLWIEGKIIKIAAATGSTEYYYFEVIGIALPSDPPRTGSDRSDIGTKYIYDTCTPSWYWVATYNTCEDALADKNCIAKSEDDGNKFLRGCDQCESKIEAPCPPETNIPPVEPPVPPPPVPPPPVEPPVEPPNNPTIRCIYEWEAKWDCVNNKVKEWSYVGKACDYRGRFFEWICTDQSSLSNGWVCTMRYYVLGPPEVVQPNAAGVLPTCNECADRTRWVVPGGGTGQSISMLGSKFFSEPNQATIDKMVPRSQLVYWPRDWPTRTSIDKQQGNTPCRCQKYYKASRCTDCNGNKIPVPNTSLWPRILATPRDILGNETSKLILYKNQCVTLTLATAGERASKTPMSNAHRWMSWWPGNQPNCEECMNGATIGKIRCDAADRVPGLPKDAKKALDWPRVTIPQAMNLFSLGYLEYLILDIRNQPALDWTKTLPIVYVDDDNICWYLDKVLCPTPWVKSQAILRKKNETTGRFEPVLAGRHTATTLTNNMDDDLRNKLTPHAGGDQFTHWKGADASCEKCVVEPTCPKLIEHDWRGPEWVKLKEFSAGGLTRCYNFKQPDCKCVAGRHPNINHNTRIGVANQGNDWITAKGGPSEPGESWAYCPKAHGGMADDEVYFYWLYRNRGKGERGLGDWKPVAGSYLTRFNRCMRTSSVTIQNGGRSVAHPVEEFPGFPKKVRTWHSCLVINFLTEDDDLEFHPFPFTCPNGFKEGQQKDSFGNVIWPKPSNCKCDPPIHDPHPIARAKSGGAKRCYCSDNTLTGAGIQTAVIDVTYEEKPRHYGVGMGDQVYAMHFSPRGGNCPASRPFQTWTNNTKAGSKWNLKWCKDCSETEWSLGLGRSGPGWYPTGFSQQGKVGLWFCGCEFARDIRGNKGVGGELLANAPYGATHSNLGTGCCYKLTNITSLSTYRNSVYNINSRWLTPPFQVVNHSAGRRYGGESASYAAGELNKFTGEVIKDPDYCGDHCDGSC